MKDFTELPSAEAMDKEVGKFIKLAERHGFRPLFEKDDAEASMRKFRKCAEGIGNPKLGYVLSSVTFVKGPHNSLNHAVKMVFTNMAGGAMWHPNGYSFSHTDYYTRFNDTVEDFAEMGKLEDYLKRKYPV